MIERVAMEKGKKCRECGLVFAATLEFFSPIKQSRDGLSGWCRACRNAYERNKRAEKMEGHPTREELERKELLREDGLINTTQFSEMLGVSRGVVKKLLSSGQVPAFRVESRFRQGGEWRVKKQDAEEYCRQKGKERVKRGESILKKVEEVVPVKEEETELLPVGSANRCGACGVRTGNIVGDVDSETRLHYGYLCSRCTRILVTSNGEIDRIEKFLVYLKKTRGQ